MRGERGDPHQIDQSMASPSAGWTELDLKGLQGQAKILFSPALRQQSARLSLTTCHHAMQRHRGQEIKFFSHRFVAKRKGSMHSQSEIISTLKSYASEMSFAERFLFQAFYQALRFT